MVQSFYPDQRISEGMLFTEAQTYKYQPEEELEEDKDENEQVYQEHDIVG